MENANTSATVNIEVAYALPDKQQVISMQVSQGTTIEQAIQLSGILEQFPDIDKAEIIDAEVVEPEFYTDNNKSSDCKHAPEIDEEINNL